MEQVKQREIVLVPKEKSARTNIIYLIAKRTIDIIGGLVGIALLMPMLIVVWIARTINKENGPIFYEQLRIGKDGKVFRFYKFRSMVVGADDVLKKYLDENQKEAKEYEKYKKMKNDPRITKTGKFLRKTSLDEWPQFINILNGTMSLVGPRPYMPRERKDMGEYYEYIIQAKPGLTGPWQIGGRSDVSFDDRMKIDKEYAEKQDLKNDIKILFKTVEKVFKKEGAC